MYTTVVVLTVACRTLYRVLLHHFSVGVFYLSLISSLHFRSHHTLGQHPSDGQPRCTFKAIASNNDICLPQVGTTALSVTVTGQI